jgi:hypothetical protein
MEKHIGLKKFLGFIVIIFGTIWVLNTIGLIMALLTGYESFDEYFNKPNYIDGEEVSRISFDIWKLLFWTCVSSLTLIKLLGGRISNINLDGYKKE